MTSIPIAVVDDETILLHGLEAWLAQTGPGLELVATTQSVAELLSGPGRSARVVLLDLRLRDHVPIADNIRQLKEAGLVVVTFSTRDDPALIREAIRAGAHSYVRKSVDPGEVRTAIEAAAAGSRYTSRAHAAAMESDPEPERPELSGQEREVLRLYATGLTMTSVARRLDIKSGTAKSYLDRVRDKYDQVGRSARTKIERATGRGGRHPPERSCRPLRSHGRSLRELNPCHESWGGSVTPGRSDRRPWVAAIISPATACGLQEARPSAGAAIGAQP